MRYRSYEMYDSSARRRRGHWGVKLLLLSIVLAGLAAVVAVSPVLLVFRHAVRLSGLSASFQEEFTALADLKITEASDSSDEAGDTSFDVIHSLAVTIPEDALAQMLHETLAQPPGRFVRITATAVRVLPDRMLIDLDVDYHLGDYTVFTTALTSEWQLRTSLFLLAAPAPNVVEVSPLAIRAAYWPTVDWTALWQVLTRPRAKQGWLPLEFTTAFRLGELLLEDGELVLTIAPGAVR